MTGLAAGLEYRPDVRSESRPFCHCLDRGEGRQENERTHKKKTRNKAVPKHQLNNAPISKTRNAASAAFDKLHAEIARAITLAHFLDRNDGGMIQAGGSFRFPTEALHVRFARPLTEANDSQRHCAVQTFLASTKYHALTAATDFLQQFVIAQFSYNCEEALAPGRLLLLKGAFEKATWTAAFWRVGWDSAPQFGRTLSALVIIGESLAHTLSLLIARILSKIMLEPHQLKWRLFWTCFSPICDPKPRT
jgi:hypothetical protein